MKGAPIVHLTGVSDSIRTDICDPNAPHWSRSHWITCGYSYTGNSSHTKSCEGLVETVQISIITQWPVICNVIATKRITRQVKWSLVEKERVFISPRYHEFLLFFFYFAKINNIYPTKTNRKSLPHHWHDRCLSFILVRLFLDYTITDRLGW